MMTELDVIKMLYQICDTTVSLGAEVILSHIDFEIHGTEKIAVVGRNGAGKTTLLRLIAGELEPDRDDRRQGPGIRQARALTVRLHRQQVFEDRANASDGSNAPGGAGFGRWQDRTVEELILESCGASEFSRERFDYEREYDRLFTGFGFAMSHKKKHLGEFSGGEQTKLALIRCLLERPDILLLDEPTNHLDMETCLWLEDYLKGYPKAVVMVSHDRFFLDRTADVVYDLEDKRLVRYVGNYTAFKEKKRKDFILAQKAYERQQEEIRRLEALIERFKHKPKKAAFARSRQKLLDRMERLPMPKTGDAHRFTGEIHPLISGSKWVLEAEHLKIGYDRPLMEVNLRIRRGQKIGIIGPNGAGKSTFLKTAAGKLSALGGKCIPGNMVTIGYFDQHSAQISSEKTVYDHFHDLFPSLTQKETRAILGSYLFGGQMAAKQVCDLSGGEKSRLVLAELLHSRPNFLILDEPTNHMDIPAKETLESAFLAYTGTILFVSHDRYFIRQVADSVLIFENGTVSYYPFGYEHYLDKKIKADSGRDVPGLRLAQEQALIEEMRAVPRAERHILSEMSTEDAYVDWRMRLASEKLDSAAAALQSLWEKAEKMREDWEASPEFWNMLPDENEKRDMQDYKDLLVRCEAAWDIWHKACMEWLDVYMELKAFPVTPDS